MSHQNLTAMNLLSQQLAYLPHLFLDHEIPNMGNSSSSTVIKPMAKDARGAQMTIFYGGQVIVFDDLPPEKAKEMMSLASSKGIGTSQTHNNNNYANYTFPQLSHPSFLANSNGPFPNFHVNIIPTTANNINEQHPQAQVLPSTPVVYDLPMTRKASLHRFLEKRKDRIAARAPYHQTSNPTGTLDKPTDESMPWLALAPQDKSESSSNCLLFY